MRCMKRMINEANILLYKEDKRMEGILAVAKDIDVHKKAVAEWAKYGISVQRVETMHDAIKQLKQSSNYLFVGIDEDSIPDFMSILPVMRDMTDLPIFVISSNYTIEKNVKALSLGADMYDNFHVQSKHNVLIAMEVLKAQNRWAKRTQKKLEVFVYGDVILSKPRRKVYVNEIEVLLGRKEFDILRYLMANYGCVVEHKQLLREIWGENYSEKDTDVLWRTVNRLRAKLSEKYPVHEYIKIERGVGYVFEMNV